MSHGHGHVGSGAAGTAGSVYKGRLSAALGLTASYAVVQVVAGFATGSLALLSDAAHMLTDVVGLALALAAIFVANRPAAGQRTYGTYRLEVLAAVTNGLLLFGAAGYILFEAVKRIADPPEILGLPMLVVAIFGLLVNIISFRLLSRGAKESINVRGAYLEVLADMVGSIGVIAAAVIVWATAWPYADALIAGGIGLFILPRTYRLMRQALRILMEVSPPHIDVTVLGDELGAIPGVIGVHDLHVWTITSGVEAASVHLSTDPGPASQVLERAQLILTRFGVTKQTVQVESTDRAHENRAPAPPVLL